ncbi:MAG: MliC family protein [Burkholderiaceae bacterium]
MNRLSVSILAPVFVAVAASGCSWSFGEGSSAAPATTDGSVATEPRARFVCQDGLEFSVRFTRAPEAAVMSFNEGRIVALYPQRAASGFWYAEGRESLRGKGSEATYVDRGGVSHNCRAQD